MECNSQVQCLTVQITKKDWQIKYLVGIRANGVPDFPIYATLRYLMIQRECSLKYSGFEAGNISHCQVFTILPKQVRIAPL